MEREGPQNESKSCNMIVSPSATPHQYSSTASTAPAVQLQLVTPVSRQKDATAKTISANTVEKQCQLFVGVLTLFPSADTVSRTHIPKPRNLFVAR